MTVYAYDTEFIEHHIRVGRLGRKVHTIELISIGIVADDGSEYYAVNADAPWKDIQRDPWLMENVIPSLPRVHGDRRNHTPKTWVVDHEDHRVKPLKKIAKDVEDFLIDYDYPELWADYGAYDHVALCRLWGRMVDLPVGMPMFTRDLQQEAASRQLDIPAQETGAHNALHDARHVMRVLREWGHV